MTLVQAARVLYDMQPKRPFIFAHFLWQIAQGKAETPESLNEAQRPLRRFAIEFEFGILGVQ